MRIVLMFALGLGNLAAVEIHLTEGWNLKINPFQDNNHKAGDVYGLSKYITQVATLENGQWNFNPVRLTEDAGLLIKSSGNTSFEVDNSVYLEVDIVSSKLFLLANTEDAEVVEYKLTAHNANMNIPEISVEYLKSMGIKKLSIYQGDSLITLQEDSLMFPSLPIVINQDTSITIRVLVDTTNDPVNTFNVNTLNIKAENEDGDKVTVKKRYHSSEIYIFGSTPYVTTVPLKSTRLTNGPQTLKTVKIRADKNGDIDVSQIAVELNSNLLVQQDLSSDSELKSVVGNFELWRNGNAINQSAYSIKILERKDGSHRIIAKLQPQVISAGTTIQYELRATVYGVKDGDFIATYIPVNLSVWMSKSANNDNAGLMWKPAMNTAWFNGNIDMIDSSKTYLEY